MNDWNAFLESEPWFIDEDSQIHLGETQVGFNLPTEFQDRFIKFSQLLSKARVTQLQVDNSHHKIVAWLEEFDSIQVWICPNTSQTVSHEVCADHKLLLSAFGGITEFTSGEFSLLKNCDNALTWETASKIDMKEEILMRVYFEEGREIPPFEFEQYYAIAEQANGDKVICHKKTSELLLLGHDPGNSSNITPLSGWPRNSLFRLNETPTFRDWVELLAEQWLRQLFDEEFV